MRVVIAGGHGQIALQLERLLVSQGHEALGIVRNPDHVADVEATGAAALVLDLESAGVDDLEHRPEGHDRLAGTDLALEQAMHRVRTAQLHSNRLADLALKYRLPSISDFDSFSRQGGLLSYGPNRTRLWSLVAEYIDKILKGARPGDLPIQEPTHFELIVNERTAKALGVSVTPFVLDRADLVLR